MSQYGSNAPPGTYVPPGQGTPNQGQQQHGFQQSHKPGGAFGQMMNQAVTTGKPMFDKLSKTITSKLGNKPSTGLAQHQQSYPNYQNQLAQPSQNPGYQQQGQAFSPQPQQQPWQQPQVPGTYPPSQQQSPYQHSNYATPVSGYSGQSNYFPPQMPQSPYPQVSQTPQQPPNPTGYGLAQPVQAGNSGLYAQTQAQQGQYGQGQPQGQYQNQLLQSGSDGQQTGVIGGSQAPGPPQYVQSAHVPDGSPAIPAQSKPQSPYGYPPQPPPQQTSQPVQPQFGHPHPGHEQTPPTAPQQQSPHPTASPQPNHPVPSTSVKQEPQQQEHWNPTPPLSFQGQQLDQFRPTSVSPPPPLHIKSKPQSPLAASPQQPQPPRPASQHSASQPSISEFIAELPADMGELSLMKTNPHGSSASGQAMPYQAFQPSSAHAGSPSPRHSIPRRAVSITNVPFADPWRFADPVTELPTREFYALADLVFETLDRKFEPRNTGMLEAPKVLGSWVELTDDASRLYTYKSYSAFAKMWTLEGIPHFMVPCQPALNPLWTYNQHTHAQDLKLTTEISSPSTTYPSYMPALNRAGWYKFFFLEIMHEPDSIDKLLQTHCSDSYRPGVLNHPDLGKREKTESPALHARAGEIQTTAIMRVCSETKNAMMADPDAHAQSFGFGSR
ncbi:hypothetical protein P153DRAFT_433715 [Dothidotthia symphoricarpi CBS 119687]|uniref:PAT1 multi-domain protein n=1 Tax=Dothidotthia symphoricarpi CBS 119687 TaxID=1392245 RepID=A0A6A6A614_9PLEO|nr:uncharacterized protein P153DRAFT_433715 [Dothidotthia symphoricarpi CBS 119687]KAF2126593.1 hypothetical protein P153DRAFT_433715 [Dothidotthia symphoricarpi CBS 119687]